ncbi:MAG TPA: RodZ domain-containing protein [bacterium]|nr:RodZ domain-containing protein [bacterium]
MAALGIGERLRSARQALGLSLEEIESVTRIRCAFLDALEREAFGDLPGPAYVRGFLRSYADYLGIPAEELLGAYPRNPPLHGAAGVLGRRDSPVEVRITPATRFSRTRGLLIGLGIVAGVGILLVGYVLLSQIRQFAQTPLPKASRPASGSTSPAVRSSATAPVRTEPVPPQAPPIQRVAPLPHPAAAPSIAPAVGGPSSLAPASAPQTSPPAAPAKPIPSPKPPPAPAASPSPTPPPATPPAGQGTPPGAPPAGAPQAGARLTSPLQIVVVASDRSWVRAVADGATVFEGIVNSGDRQVWSAKRELIIRVGNASGVNVSVNGRDLGHLGGAGQVVERTYQVGGEMTP